MTALSEFDVGPLTWVKAQIDQQLAEARDKLAALIDNPDDTSPLRFCQTHLHQITGALEMVGLAGAARFGEEIERVAAGLEKRELKLSAAALELLKNAINALGQFLEELVNGEPNVALKLFPLFARMRELRGVQKTLESELFYPDLSVRAPKIETKPVADAELPAYIKAARSRFQRGLLGFLRSNDKNGLAAMRAALHSVEVSQALPINRTFWWTAGGFVEALRLDALSADFNSKQLCGRIDQQMRRLSEGSVKVAERLLRDVLYCIAKSEPKSDLIAQIQDTYGLIALLPPSDVQSEQEIRVSALQPVLRELRDLLGVTKELWLKFSSGNKEALAQINGELERAKAKLGALETPAMERLFEQIGAAVAALITHPERANESVSMEMATALLLAENGVTGFANLSDEFPVQVDVQTARLSASVAGKLESLGANVVPLLDEMSRRAQEKLLLAQIGHEIRANLQQAEVALDAYFRNNTKREELRALGPLLNQVSGALRILELERADELLRASQTLIAKFVEADYAAPQEEWESVAEGLSSLGFYVEAVQHGREDAYSIIEPILRRQPGFKARSEPASEEEPAPVVHAETVESGIAEQKQELGRLLEAWQKQPDDTLARDSLKTMLTALSQDADLIADPELKEQTATALKALAASDEHKAEAADVAGAVAAVSAPKVAAVVPSAETSRLSEAADEVVDAELLETYLEEAVEVLATIEENLVLVKQQSTNKDAMTNIRRGFHTLKGSGRMVGLMALGEVAWNVEQVMNKWLQEEKAASPSLIELIERADQAFSGWVAQLQTHGSCPVNARALADFSQQLLDDATSPSFNADLDAANDAPIEAAAEAETAVVEAESATPSEVESAAVAEKIELSAFAASEEPVATEVQETEVQENAPAELEFATFSEPADEQSAFFDPAGEPVAEAPSVEEFVAQNSDPSGDDVIDQAAVADFGLSDAALSTEEIEFSEVDAAFFEAAANQVEETEIATPSVAEASSHGDDAMREPEAEFAAHSEAAESPSAPADVATEIEAVAADEAVEDVETPPAAKEIIIGGLLIAPELFHIFMEEAAEHLRALDGHASALRQGNQVDHEFMRAAHTLCGTARTVGFTPLAELSYALEQWLREQLDFPQIIDAKQSRLVADTVSALHKMIETIRSGRFPKPAKQLMRSLNSLFSRAVAQRLNQAEERRIAEEQAHQEAVALHAEQLNGHANDMAVAPAEIVLPEPAELESPVSAAPAFADESVVAVAQPSEQDASPAEGVVQAEQSAPQQPASASNEPQLTMQDDLDEQLLPIFIEEANDLMPAIAQGLRDWRANPGDGAISQNLQRGLHTLKGSARMAGAMRLGELTHRLETSVIEATEKQNYNEALFDSLDTAYDQVADVYEWLRNPSSAPAPVAAATAAPANEERTLTAAQGQGPVLPQFGLADVEAAAKAVLRVRADVIDRLVNEAGEVSIARSRIEGEMRGFKHFLLELTENVIRLRNQLREVEIQAESQMQSRLSSSHEIEASFDPLEFDRFTRFQELTRMMAESVNDVSTIQQNLLKSLDETEAALLQQGRMTRTLQQELMRTRMVPLGSIAERLHRIVRQTAKELGKKANLELSGTQVELDRSVLEKMTAPFEHLLRNAIAHGLEGKAERVAAGKSENGEITLRARQEGNEIVLSVADDGAGIDLSRVRAKALALGMFDEATPLSETQLLELIFQSGFSTAQEVTQIAGRGVGMDVVRNEISALGGRIEIATEQGRGTTFTIYLPLTLAVTQAVLIKAGEKTYALPSAMVEQVQEHKAEALAEIYKKHEVSWLNNRYPVHYLPRLFGDAEHTAPVKRYSSIMLLRSGTSRAAIHVDELIGNQEIVVKNIGPQLARVPGIAGATVLGNGEVVLIVNPVQLAHREVLPTISTRVAPIVVDEPPMAPVIMIVDDSLTVRKITSRLLSKEGYQVVTAKDGVDALEQVQLAQPDVMLVDIEMPRMDGFELTKILRGDPHTSHIPIIMITSRTAEKHRNYATELGVNVYLGKPYQEEELLGHIASFVRQGATVH